MADGSEKSGGSGAMVQIIVAVIGVTGVISAALFANWDKIFGGNAAAVAQSPAASPPAAAPADVPAQAGAATQLSQSQQRAYGAASDALDSVAGQIGSAGQSQNAPASVAGMWHDTDGYSYDVRQQGSAISYQQYYKGALVGSGGGQIQGQQLSYTYLTSDDRGQCAGTLAASGDQISGRCQSVSGNGWPFTVVR